MVHSTAEACFSRSRDNCVMGNYMLLFVIYRIYRKKHRPLPKAAQAKNEKGGIGYLGIRTF